jgi:hypothetical protein
MRIGHYLFVLMLFATAMSAFAGGRAELPGVSFERPQGNWSASPVTRDSGDDSASVVFSRIEPDLSHSSMVAVSAGSLKGAPADKAGAWAYLKDFTTKKLPRNVSAGHLVFNEITELTVAGAPCLRLHIAFEVQIERQPKPYLDLSNIDSVYCQHPDRPNYLAWAMFVGHAPKGAEALAQDEEFMALVNSMRFTPLKS